MRKLLLFLFPLCVGFGIGHIVGYNRGHSIKCPKDLSAALKGCELVASSINSQLSECEYKLGATQAALENCADDMRSILRQALPGGSGKTMRKP